MTFSTNISYLSIYIYIYAIYFIVIHALHFGLVYTVDHEVGPWKMVFFHCLTYGIPCLSYHNGWVNHTLCRSIQDGGDGSHG